MSDVDDILKSVLGAAKDLSGDVREQRERDHYDNWEEVQREKVLASRRAAAPCPHTTLTPRWDSARDMGHANRATSFFCEGCQQTFTPDEAKAFRTS